ncbi:type IV secretion system protein [Belliella sp. R4-6]|uniref:Type IV secretion system protein n=1 Tax=Belliella alkalica TaxID=1730871 RepID=A0ABS9VD33_9BACT|nr:type IV secretion system protein [Belliella alkalica]MCH7414348.1 type IV secretion system protein [Belliella alkalica]
MKNKTILLVIALALLLMLPEQTFAQGLTGNVRQFHGILQRLYDDMIPLASQLIGVGRAIAGFASLLFISQRVWRHLANAEPIDMYPLLRPFAIGMAILLFPSLMGLMNGVLSPLVRGTENMVDSSNDAIIWHIDKQKEDTRWAIENQPPANQSNLDQYEEQEANENLSGGTWGGRILYAGMKNMALSAMRWLLELLYVSAALCINTIRTFHLIVLTILGPVVLGLSVFEGFQHILSNWIAKYVNVYLWLPIANIFGAITAKILENMALTSPEFFGGLAYSVFMLLAIIGYFTIPNIANYIISGGSRDGILHKATKMAGGAVGAGATATVGMMK